jgi:hypothetical protein
MNVLPPAPKRYCTIEPAWITLAQIVLLIVLVPLA